MDVPIKPIPGSVSDDFFGRASYSAHPFRKLKSPPPPPFPCQTTVTMATEGGPALVRLEVMQTVVLAALDSTDSFKRSQTNDFTLHEIIQAASSVFARLKFQPQEQKDYNRLIGTMASDRECPDWREKLKKCSQYAEAFKYTPRPIMLITSSPGLEDTTSPMRGRTSTPRRKRRKSPRKMNPSSKKGALSTPATPSSIPIPPITLYSASAPHERLELVTVDNTRPPEPPQDKPETNSDEDERGKSVR